MSAATSRRRLLIVTAGTLAVSALVTSLVGGLAANLSARQVSRPPAGTRIFVAAFRDSRLLTLCPVAGKEVSMPGRQAYWAPAPGVKAVVAPVPVGDLQSIRVTDPVWLRSTGAATGWAMLPTPAKPGRLAGAAAGFPGISAPAASVAALPPELDRLALDLDVGARVAQTFREDKRYTVVDTLDRADYVFVAETSYTSAAAWASTSDRAASPPIPKIDQLSDGTRVVRPEKSPQLSGVAAIADIGGDRKLNWRQAALAVVVPADAYRRFPTDGAGLSANRIWEGFSLQETIRGQRGVEMREGRAEVLAAEFSGKWREPIVALAVCAASAVPLRVASTAVPLSQGASPDAPGGAAPSVQPPRQQGGVFRSGVTLVRVPFTVADDNGRAIVDIEPSELHVFEDGVEQKVDTILPASASTTLALLLDLSASMRQYRQDLQLAALTLAEVMRPADRLLVASFDTDIRVLAEFTRDPAILKRAAVADSSPGFGGTRLYDAIDLVSEDRLRDVNGRAAMVVVTDGMDTHSRIVDAAGTRDVIDDANIAVYVIRYDTGDTLGRLPFQISVSPRSGPRERSQGVQPPPNPRNQPPAMQGGRWLVVPDEVYNGAEVQNAADQFLSRISTTSGGRMYYAPPGTDLRDVLASIMEELSRQFTICYYPTNAKADGTYRQIAVTIDRPGHTVRSRKGYRAGGR